MSRFALGRLISFEMDPYFLSELTVLFAVLVFDFYILGFSSQWPIVGSLRTIISTGLLLKGIYVFYVMVLAVNVYAFTYLLESGKILTLVAFGYSAKRVMMFSFIWAVIYPTLLSTLIFSANIYLFEFGETLPALFEMLFYILSFSVMVIGTGFLISILIRNLIIPVSSTLVLFLIALPDIFSKASDKNFIFYALTGFHSVGISDPFSMVFLSGGILEIFIGFVFLIIGSSLLKRRSLKPVRM